MNKAIMDALQEQRLQWKVDMNSDRSRLKELYRNGALLFHEFDPVRKGNAVIGAFYDKEFPSDRVIELHTDYLIQLGENLNMAYELGSFSTEQGRRYCSLCIWSRDEAASDWYKELEAVALIENSLTREAEIAQIRKQWVTLANRHSSLNLVQNTYSGDFTYYNRGQIVQGYEALAEAYSYMNFKAFSINLLPEIHIPVKENLAFEIGTWHSQGTGSYIIVWKMDVSEGWRIYLDSNW